MKLAYPNKNANPFKLFLKTLALVYNSTFAIFETEYIAIYLALSVYFKNGIVTLDNKFYIPKIKLIFSFSLIINFI